MGRPKLIGDELLRHHLHTTQGYDRESFSINLPVERIAHLLYNCYLEVIGTRHREVIYDDFLENEIYSIAECLSVPSHKFSMIFTGSYGNGKTTMMLALRKMICYIHNRHNQAIAHLKGFNFSIPLIVSKDAALEIIEKGYTYMQYSMLMIDDLGSEPSEIRRYGMVYTPITDLLLSRYSAMKYTILSTNLTMHQIRPMYGDRVADRLNEIAHVIHFLGPSYRDYEDQARLQDSTPTE